MNIQRLYEILSDSTCQLRKGESVVEKSQGALDVVEIFDMPSVHDAKPELEKVDMEFLVIGVDRAKAETYRGELIEILKAYPNPEQLKGGPSYIEVGGEIGDQGAAFQLFALGKTLGLWDVITPSRLGLTGVAAINAAGSGYIMMTGYDVNGQTAEAT